jgi:hypothetical protein
MPLPQFYRFIAYNDTGQTITYNSNGRLNLKMTAWKWDTTNGDIVYTPLSDNDLGFGAGDATADGAEDKSSEIDNTSNEYVGLQVQLEVTHDEGAAADGNYLLYLDGGDATGELASDATGYENAVLNALQLVGVLKWHSSGGDDEVMRSAIFEVGG